MIPFYARAALVASICALPLTAVSVAAQQAATPMAVQEPVAKHHSVLKGAIVGAGAGHVANHHAVAGAVVGAMVQHHRNHAEKKAEQKAAKAAAKTGGQ